MLKERLLRVSATKIGYKLVQITYQITNISVEVGPSLRLKEERKKESQKRNVLFELFVV